MFSQALSTKISQLFPNVKIEYKNQSTFMKILGKVLFLAPEFMTSYDTTIGSTIYFPSSDFVNIHPVSSIVVLLHELVHVYDENRLTKLLFGFLYLFPQILFLITPLLFLFSWKIALFGMLLFAAPIPAYFRMIFEKRAYMASLYCMKKLNDKYNYNINLDIQVVNSISQFKTGTYYFMWPFTNIDNEFVIALQNIKNGQRPYDDEVFDVLDEILTVA